MKIINAIWEQENLGVSTSEIIFEKNDKVVDCINKILELKEKYLVAKIPSDNLEILNALVANDYKFIETQFSLEYSSKNYAIPKIYERYMKSTSVLKADNNDINFVLDLVRNGKIFITDRISIDSYFNLKQSGNRYYNWMKTLMKSGSEMYIAQYKNEKVGFSLNSRIDNTTFNAVLGGIFPEFENKGLGFLAIHGNMSSIYEKGGNKVITAVSSNNMPILRLHLVFGYIIANIHYIVVKHT